MVDYSKGKIYKIVCNTTGLIYVGSTCKPKLCQRLSKHVSDYKRHLNKKAGYMTSFEILENNNYVIVLLEEYPCNNKDQLHKKEREWIEKNVCVNKVIPSRTIKEYNQTSKRKEVNRNNTERYRQNNQDIIKEKQKIYRETNTQKIKEYKAQKYICQCGSFITINSKAKHERSNYHKNHFL